MPVPPPVTTATLPSSMLMGHTLACAGAAVSLGVVVRRVAEDGPGVLEVAIAPAVVRDHEEDAEAHGLRGGQGALDHLRDVALAAPHGELPLRGGPVLGVHRADAQAQHRH